MRNHLPQQCKFSRKEIGIDIFYNESKLFTTISWVFRVILRWTHGYRYHLKDQPGQRACGTWQ